MDMEWMGRYRELVRQLQHFGNRYALQYNREINCGNGVQLSPAQLQVLQYLVENERQNLKMSQVAKGLDIMQSTFSKCVSRMEEKGMLEKYHTADNRKDVIIRASSAGKDAWLNYSLRLYPAYQQFFKALEDIPDGTVKRLADALSYLLPADASREDKKEEQLIRIDPALLHR